MGPIPVLARTWGYLAARAQRWLSSPRAGGDMAEATQQGSLGGSSSRAGSDELRVCEGMRPTRTGDLVLEGQGMAPIPAGHRYGGGFRVFSVWFTPHMGLPGGFAGTLAGGFGLGFGLGLVAIVAGAIVGSLPVALFCPFGPANRT